MRIRTLSILLFLLIASLGSTTPSQAASKTLTVTTTADTAPNGCTVADCTLREAVIRSNATSATETIVLDALPYELTIAGAGEDLSATGDLDIRRPVIIAGNPGDTDIDQQTVDRVLHVVGGTTGKLTLRGVKALHGDVAGAGGGLMVDNNRVATLRSSTITTNEASLDGGGIYALGRLTLIDSVVSNNDAGNSGGGIASLGPSVTITRSHVISNSSAGVGGGSGGGITFTSIGKLAVLDSTIDGNVAVNNGGGIELPTAVEFAPDFSLRRSTVSNNAAGVLGGGLYLANGIGQGGVQTIDDATVSGNSTKGRGGGIYCNCNVALSMTHTTITKNTADSDTNSADSEGGAFFSFGVRSLIRASIVAGNIDTGNLASPDCDNMLETAGANVLNATCVIAPAATDVAVTDASFLNPLGPNGGPTKTHAILGVSAPVDIHDGAACGGTDQRGVPRPTNKQDCDAGAYERSFCGSNPVTIVGTNGPDTLDGTPANDGILGKGGNDLITGAGGADAICAGPGKDRLFGGSGDDVLNGGSGKDRCFGFIAEDTFIGCETKLEDV